MYNGDPQIGEESLEKADVKPREVLVPVFMQVRIPQSEDELQAEMLALDRLRELPPYVMQNGVSIALSSIICPICK